MARQRTVKPEFWQDERLALQLSRDARLLYVGMWNLADEEARVRLSPHFVKGQVFAYDDDLGPGQVSSLIDELVTAGRIHPYMVSGERYGLIVKLAGHQRLEPGKTPSKLPAPESADPEPVRELREVVRANPEPVPDESAQDPDESALSYSSIPSLSSSVTSPRPEPSAPPPPAGRADVDELCALLAEKITGNGNKPPTVTKAWRDAARLLLDADARPFDEVRRLILWCQADEFWRCNVLSMPTFREKYDQLRMKAQSRASPGRVQPFRNPADQSAYQEAL